MSLFPVLGVVVTLFVPLAVLVGEGWLVAQIAVFFFLLLILLSAIAVEIDGEDRWLTLYAPFSAVGYKQFLDVVLFVALYDVLTKRDLGWTFAGRSDDLDPASLEYDPTRVVAPVEDLASTETDDAESPSPTSPGRSDD